ncbi:MAG TPA: transketolase C-terminal domain-containing protein [Candidatus Binatia bacterium]|jgi:transketolase|nr:transketolase C-terminal domain-containing protein [Candidatus Binatia bacterium]
MRGAFVRTLTALAADDPRIVLLTGDLGYMALEPFSERFPERFFNLGVAEQNMVGAATGMAEAGFVPFAYSIATFAALRPFEFIRNGPVWHRLPVRIVGCGGGFDYGPQGTSHHALEDLGVMRTLPGLTIVAPADHRQMATALAATWDVEGPVYYRIGKDDRTEVPGLDGRFRPGHAETVREGEDVLLLACGSITPEATKAADALAAGGVRAGVAVVASIQPAPVDDLVALLARVPVVLTVEAHVVSGGLGSLVAEIIAERGLGTRLVRCGVRTAPDGVSGSQAWMQAAHGLSAPALAETARAALDRRAG